MATKKRPNYKADYKEISKIDQTRQPQEYIHKYKKFEIKDSHLYYCLIASLTGKAIFDLKEAIREGEDLGFYNPEKYEAIAIDSFVVDKVLDNKELEDKIYRAIEMECIKAAKNYLLEDLEE